MKAKHTKGEWRVSQILSGIGNIAIVDDDSKRIARVVGGTEEYEANARLIASAPALLSALVIAKNYLIEYAEGEADIHVMDRINNAIKKAIG